ncbi:50S ribosomal protein L24 [Agaribacterium sp. ZY112]|uniref:50S ribosomal protein L24 n=1 Tax=Agaribacterium sp. ZY112 TaxID=3233574 RepID=UPI0035267B14
MKKLKKNDEVIVTTGRDKGKRGKINRVLDDGRLIVSGIQMVKKHTKPNPQLGVQGGIVEKEAPIDPSNVAIFNSATQKADKVAIKVEGEKKIRVFKSNGEAVDG